jgi:hypothetical protein
MRELAVQRYAGRVYGHWSLRIFVIGTVPDYETAHDTPDTTILTIELDPSTEFYTVGFGETPTSKWGMWKEGPSWVRLGRWELCPADHVFELVDRIIQRNLRALDEGCVPAITDPIEFIRTRPEMYVPEGHVPGAILAGRLVADALIGPDQGHHAAARRLNEWWIVGSDWDWVDWYATATVEEYFHRIVPFPNAGPDAIHAEVLLTAFAKDVVTFARSTHWVVRGGVSPTDPIFELPERFPKWRRIVAFRFDDL